MIVRVYESTEAGTPPARQFVALVDWNGYKGNRHLVAFLYGPTREEAQRKGEEYAQETMNPAKRAKTSSDGVVPCADNTDYEPV